jgi:hypothetical protein
MPHFKFELDVQRFSTSVVGHDQTPRIFGRWPTSLAGAGRDEPAPKHRATGPSGDRSVVRGADVPLNCLRRASRAGALGSAQDSNYHRLVASTGEWRADDCAPVVPSTHSPAANVTLEAEALCD